MPFIWVIVWFSCFKLAFNIASYIRYLKPNTLIPHWYVVPYKLTSSQNQTLLRCCISYLNFFIQILPIYILRDWSIPFSNINSLITFTHVHVYIQLVNKTLFKYINVKKTYKTMCLITVYLPWHLSKVLFHVLHRFLFVCVNGMY